MRPIFTLLFSLLFAASTFAQFTFNAATQGPFIGNQWAGYQFRLSLTDNPIPNGENQTNFDFTYLGDLIEFDYLGVPIFDGLAIKNVSLDSFWNTRVLAAPTTDDVAAGETFVFPAYDDNILQFENYEPANYDQNENSGSQRVFLRKTANGLFDFGQAFFRASADGIVLADTSGGQRLVLPYDFATGDSVASEYYYTYLDSFQDLEDSSVYKISFKYLENVTLATHFGQFSNVALVRTIVQNDRYNRDLILGDAYTYYLTSYDVDYSFYQQGNAVPLLEYYYKIDDPLTLEPATEEVRVTFNQPRTLVNVADAEAAHIQLSVFPNPTSERVTVAFEQAAAQDVQVVLRDVTGRQLARRAYGNLLPGSQRVNFDLPRGLPVGSYLLQVVSGQATTARVLAVRR